MTTQKGRFLWGGVFLPLLLTIAIAGAYGQKTSVKGVVLSGEDSEPIIGASVMIKGTSTGTITDVDGKFELEAPNGAKTVVISYVGMASQELSVSPSMHVILKLNAQNLDEVVVTALGISREKKTLGYAVQQVAGEELNTVKSSNFVTGLSGKVSGLQIKNSTTFGGSTNVLIRGASSLTQNNQALFVIDGVPIDNANVNSKEQLSGRSGFDYGNTASDVNPNDIESISVLKGAAATALYGSRAASGVILITTKKGTANKKPTVRFSSNVTLSRINEQTFPEYQTEYGAGYGPWYSSETNPYFNEEDIDGDGIGDLLVPYNEDASRGAKLDGTMVRQWDSFYPSSPNFGKKTPYLPAEHGPVTFFETGIGLTNSIDVSGGGSASTFRLGYTNTDQTGTQPNSLMQRNNISFSGSLGLLKNLNVSASANYIHTYTKGRPSTGYNDNVMSMFRQWYQANVDIKMMEHLYKSGDGNATWNRNAWNDASPAYWDNLYWARYENYEDDTRSRLIGYAKVDWDITDFLSLMGRYSVDTYNYLQEERKAVGSHAEPFGVGADPFAIGQDDASSGYSRLTRSFIETNADLLLNFNKKIGGDFDIAALLGLNIRRNRVDQMYISTNNGLSVPGVFALSNSVDPILPPEETFERIGINGIFGSASVGYKSMLFIEGTLRRDQASTLPVEANSYYYPSVTGSFIFSGLVDQSWLSFGKVRLNFAEVGNSAPALKVKDSYSLITPFGGVGMATVPDSRNNPNLKPERQRATEAGLEMNFFHNRLGFDLAVYENRTFDQIVPISVSFATGYLDRWSNAGEISNKGIELSLHATPVKTRDFSWETRLNWTKNHNQVISLYKDENGNEVTNLQLASLQTSITINARVGEPYGVICGSDYVYHENGGKLIDENGLYEISQTNDNVLGNVNPEWTGGWGNTFTYKNLSLGFLIDVQKGGSVFSLDMYYGGATGILKESAGLNDLGNPKRDPIVWVDDDDHSKGYVSTSGGTIYPGVLADGTPNHIRVDDGDFGYDGYQAYPQRAVVYDASYVKLRELSLTYSFPKSLLAKTRCFSDASLSLVGSNLWIFHKNLPYADPESSQSSGNVQGFQSGVTPAERTFGVTLNVQF